MTDSLYANPAHKAFRNTKFFGSLDGLRCISILAVIWHHTAGHSFSMPLAGRGHHGVTLFFGISGFLITTLLIREHEKNGSIDLRKFYIRRSLRIFPLYYSVLFVYIILVLLMERGTSVGKEFMGHLPAYITYTSNWFVDLNGERVVFYFAWSLATEEQFYLIWPWIQKYTKFWVPVIFMSVLLVIAFLASKGFLGLGDGFLITVLKSIMPGICLGAILAHVLHHKRTFPWVAKVLGYRWSAPFFLAIFFAYCALQNIETWVVHALGVLLVGASIIREDHFIAKPFKFFPIRWIGTVSYGMYMLHMLAKNGFGMMADKLGFDQLGESVGVHPDIFEFVGTTVIVIFLATISFKFYESYFLNLKKRFAQT